MNKFKTLTIAALIAVCATLAVKADTLTQTSSGLATTNRASVYQVTLTSSDNTTVKLFDSDSTAAPYYGTNYVNAAYTTRTTYPTNYVTSFVGYNGVTNWSTNAGIWTLTITNAANTNALTPKVVAVCAGNTYVVQDVDALFVRGIYVLSTSTNSSVVISYRSAN